MSEESEESPQALQSFEKFTAPDFCWGMIGSLGGMAVGGGIISLYEGSSSSTQGQTATLHYQQAGQQIAKLYSQIGGLKTLQADSYSLSTSPRRDTLISRAAKQDITHKQQQIQKIEASTVQPRPARDDKAGKELDIFLGATTVGVMAGVLLSCGKRFIVHRRAQHKEAQEFYRKMQADEQARHLDAWLKL